MLEVNSWLSAKLNIAKSSLSVWVQQAVLRQRLAEEGIDVLVLERRASLVTQRSVVNAYPIGERSLGLSSILRTTHG